MLLNCHVGEDSLRVPWTARSSKQSVLKEINLYMYLKDWYWDWSSSLGHLMRRTDLLENTLMLGKIAVRRRKEWRAWDGWMASLTPWAWVWTTSGSQWQRGKPGILLSMGLQGVRHHWTTELNWRLMITSCFFPQACGTEFNYCHSLDLSADTLSD